MNRYRWLLLFLLSPLFLDLWQSFSIAADTFPAPRTIEKEPIYQSKTPRYGRLVFGKEGKDQVWIVHDGDLLYVDRNGNGDLTEPGERIERQKPRKGFEDTPGRSFEVGELKLGGLTHKRFRVDANPLKQFANATVSRQPGFKEEIQKDPEAIAYHVACEVEVPGIKGGGIDGRLSVTAGYSDAQGFLIFDKVPASAPAVRLGGPIQIDFPDFKPQLRIGYAIDMAVSIGFSGQGSGTFAAIAYDDTLPPEAKPIVEVEVPSATQGTPAFRETYELPSRCCGISLYGPVRVDGNLSAANAIVTLSLPAWKEAQVVPTRHALTIVKGKALHPDLPVSSELAWTIRHPDKLAYIMHQKYSPDGKRLFLTGYPSGIVQFWDLESRKEIRRMEGEKGYRGTADYALLTPDWKTVLVGEETRKVKRLEDQGKQDTRIEYSGRVQIWDAETGEQKSFLHPASGYGAGYCQLSPDGKRLVLVEMKSYLTSEAGKASVAQTSLWDLQTQERRLLGDGFMAPNFSSDSKFGYFSITNNEKKTSMIKKIDLDSGETLAEFDCKEQDRQISLQGVSPDNRWLAAELGGKLGAPPTILFLDTTTLKEKARLVLEADPKTYGWQPGSFSPDSKLFEVSDGQGDIHLWGLDEKKVIRSIPMQKKSRSRSFSPDGQYLAIVWVPKTNEVRDEGREPEPIDLPQPRISLFDLNDPTKAPIVLIAPHGYCGSISFRPDGKQLAFGSSGGVHIFDIEKLVTKKEKR